MRLRPGPILIIDIRTLVTEWLEARDMGNYDQSAYGSRRGAWRVELWFHVMRRRQRSVRTAEVPYRLQVYGPTIRAAHESHMPNDTSAIELLTSASGGRVRSRGRSVGPRTMGAFRPAGSRCQC